MAQKWPKTAQKLAPAKKIAEIYLPYLPLFPSLDNTRPLFQDRGKNETGPPSHDQRLEWEFRPNFTKKTFLEVWTAHLLSWKMGFGRPSLPVWENFPFFPIFLSYRVSFITSIIRSTRNCWIRLRDIRINHTEAERTMYIRLPRYLLFIYWTLFYIWMKMILGTGGHYCSNKEEIWGVAVCPASS